MVSVVLRMANEPLECIHCGGDNIDAEPDQIDHNYIYRNVYCCECKGTWMETFRFESIEVEVQDAHTRTMES